jgi:hypothetical protein
MEEIEARRKVSWTPWLLGLVVAVVAYAVAHALLEGESRML